MAFTLVPCLISRCTRCRSCLVVSPAFFVAPAYKPSSRRYLIGRVFCFQNSCEGKYSLLIQILKGKMATDFAKSFSIILNEPLLIQILKGKMTCVFMKIFKMFTSDNHSTQAFPSTYPDSYRQNITIFRPTEQIFYVVFY